MYITYIVDSIFRQCLPMESSSLSSLWLKHFPMDQESICQWRTNMSLIWNDAFVLPRNHTVAFQGYWWSTLYFKLHTC
jgi:hypothetical protein